MISVAMATYNGRGYIIEQLESIRMQRRKADEIVIVDDCSQDETPALIRRYMEQHKDFPVRYYENEKNQGYKKNFRKALSLCRGEMVFLCDQDDVWLPNKVEVMTRILEEFPQVGVISSSFFQLDGSGHTGKGKKVYQRKIPFGEKVAVPLEDLIFHNISQGCSMAVRREIVDLYLRFFREDLPHDWMINILAAMEKKCFFLHIPLFYYRIHDKNTIGLNEGMTLGKKNTWEVRAKDAQYAIRVLDFIQEADGFFYQRQPWLEDARTFATDHITYLKDKDVKGVLIQNRNSFYKRLKTLRGRVLDIFFCIGKTRKEE